MLIVYSRNVPDFTGWRRAGLPSVRFARSFPRAAIFRSTPRRRSGKIAARVMTTRATYRTENTPPSLPSLGRLIRRIFFTDGRLTCATRGVRAATSNRPREFFILIATRRAQLRDSIARAFVFLFLFSPAFFFLPFLFFLSGRVAGKGRRACEFSRDRGRRYRFENAFLPP